MVNMSNRRSNSDVNSNKEVKKPHFSNTFGFPLDQTDDAMQLPKNKESTISNKSEEPKKRKTTRYLIIRQSTT